MAASVWSNVGRSSSVTAVIGRSSSHSCELLARVQQTLRIERELDLLVQLDRSRVPLVREQAALEHADAMLGGDRAPEPADEFEQLVPDRLGRCELLLARWVDEHRRVDVAVAAMPPRARAQTVACGDLVEALESLAQALDRERHVL